jgi:hypothetical protein
MNSHSLKIEDQANTSHFLWSSVKSQMKLQSWVFIAMCKYNNMVLTQRMRPQYLTNHIASLIIEFNIYYFYIRAEIPAEDPWNH